MGKNNRQRRAAKVRKRPRQHRQHWHPAGDRGRGGGSSDTGFVFSSEDRFLAAVFAERAGDNATAKRAVDLLASEPPQPVALVVARLLEAQVSGLWQHGWQPADLDRAAGRELAKSEAALICRVVASEMQRYEGIGRRVAPGWMAQLESMGASRSWDPRRPYLLQVARPWPEVILSAVQAMSFLFGLPVLPRLTDPPSEWGNRSSAITVPRRSLPTGVLEKVRALLAKAESTTFDAEAEAFTAKAQELMTRHRIDRAILDSSGTDEPEEPLGRRIGVDDPYADAKALLLGGVADANGCRAVWSKAMGFTTIFGFADDLDAVEELFTSLLVQATAALRREGSKHDRFGRSRTRRFRRSFLVAFGVRIGQRLHETAADTVAAADTETTTALVPILAARDDAAKAAADKAFPQLSSFSPTATDGEGWFAGTLFGDQADLAAGPELGRRSA